MKRAIIIGFVVVVVIGGGFLFATRGSSSNDQGFTLIPVERGIILDKALATGQIEPEQEFQVKSHISGIVKTVFVDVGDDVKRGDRLLEINPNPTPLELTEGERNLELAQLVYNRAQADHKRIHSLWESGLLSSEEYEASSNSLDEARVGRSLAGERLALIKEGKIRGGKKNIDSVIRSSASGTVLERLVDPGEPVVPLTSFQEGTVLITIADMSRLIFRGTVDEIDVGKLKLDIPVRLSVGALPSAEITGILTRIAPKAQERDGSTLFDVEVEIIERGDAYLRAGYSANADIVINEKTDVLLIPERLVIFEGEKIFVEVPSEKSGAEPLRREIEIGLSDGLQIEVLSGLEENENVIQRPPREI